MQVNEKLKNGEKKRVNLNTKVLDRNYNVSLEILCESSNHKDSIKKDSRIVSRGFPQQLFASGSFSLKNQVDTHSFTIPDDFCEGSFNTSINLNFSVVSNLGQALKSLVREPYGCFEQMSA